MTDNMCHGTKYSYGKKCRHSSLNIQDRFRVYDSSRFEDCMLFRVDLMWYPLIQTFKNAI